MTTANELVVAANEIAARVTPALMWSAAKGLVVVAAAWAVVRSMRATSAARRHAVWVLAVLGLTALPMLTAVLPRWNVLPHQTFVPQRARVERVHVTRPSAVTIAQVATSIPPPVPSDAATVPIDAVKAPAPGPAPSTAPPLAAKQPPPPALSPAAYALLAWACGIFVALVPIALAAWALWRVQRSARPLDDVSWRASLHDCSRRLNVTRRVRLLAGASGSMPMTWGVVRPAILLPADCDQWPPARREAVLLHELAHVRRRDCLWQLLCHATCAAYWFNPLAWLALAQVRREQESACDDLVICCGGTGCAAQYAGEILEAVAVLAPAGLTRAAAIAMARPSHLEGRIRAILDPRLDRAALTWKWAAGFGLLVAAFVLPIAAIRAAETPAQPPQSKELRDAASRPAFAEPAAEKLPPLPDKLPRGRVALRVLAPSEKPLDVHDIASIYVFIEPDSKWLMGPKPQVLDRYGGGWVTVDESMFALAQPGQRVEMTFAPSPGTALTVTGEFPKDKKRVTLRSAALPQEVGVDVSAGPADVKDDEVAGLVVDPAGKPVAGATVSFPRGFGDVTSIRPPVTTAADGVFRFGDFAHQHYLFMQVDKEGYATRWITDVPIGKGFAVRLDDRTRVRGQLTLPDGSPAAAATLELLTNKPTVRARMANPISNIMRIAQADGEGRYDVPLEPGEYDVSVRAAAGGFVARHEKFNVPARQVVALPQELTRGPRLRLRAIDSITDKPVAGVKFYVQEPRAGSIRPREGTERTTDAQGTAEWESLMPGPSSIGVWADGYARWWIEGEREKYHRAIDSLHVDIRPGMEVVTVKMEPAMRVTGQLLSPDGKPVEGASVDVAGLSTGDARYRRQTDAQGKFVVTFPDLESTYATSRAVRNYAIVAHDKQGRWANGVSESFAPTPGVSKDVTIRMTPGGRVRGRVVDANGKPVANIEVEADSADGMDRNYYNPRTLTGADGRYDLGPMRPASYTLYVDTEFGVNIKPGPPHLRRQVDVREGEVLEDVELIYAGPPPPPVPQHYYNSLGAPASRRSTGGAAAPATSAARPRR